MFCLCVCLLNNSACIYQSVNLSLTLHLHVSACLSLFLSLSLLADADPESFDSVNVFFIHFNAVLVDEGRGIQIPQKRAIIRPSAKRHLMTLVALESIRP